MDTLTSVFARRPAAAIALTLTALWMVWTAYEVIHNSTRFVGNPGTYEQVGNFLATSVQGVVVFVGLAILVEWVWPGLRDYPRHGQG